MENETSQHDRVCFFGHIWLRRCQPRIGGGFSQVINLIVHFASRFQEVGDVHGIQNFSFLIIPIFSMLHLVSDRSLKKKTKKAWHCFRRGSCLRITGSDSSNLIRKGICWKVVKYLTALMERLENLVQKTGRNQGN